MVLLLELLSAVCVILHRKPTAWMSHFVLGLGVGGWGRACTCMRVLVIQWKDVGYRLAFIPYFRMEPADRVHTSHALPMTVGAVPDAQAGFCCLVFPPVNPLDTLVHWGMFLV